MSSKGKGKAVTPRRSRRLSGTPTSTPTTASTTASTPVSKKACKSGSMLVVVVDEHGKTKEYFCEHRLLYGLEGKQRPLAKFLTSAMMEELENVLDDVWGTRYKKIWDKKYYKYTSEPEAGDIDSDDEDFRIEPFKDGRYFANALFLDFVKNFGREAKTGDKAASTAYIIDRPSNAHNT